MCVGLSQDGLEDGVTFHRSSVSNGGRCRGRGLATTADRTGFLQASQAEGHAGADWGWVSNSPFTRAMFRPLPTLFFTGLMILKKKEN